MKPLGPFIVPSWKGAAILRGNGSRKKERKGKRKKGGGRERVERGNEEGGKRCLASLKEENAEIPRPIFPHRLDNYIPAPPPPPPLPPSTLITSLCGFVNN